MFVFTEGLCMQVTDAIKWLDGNTLWKNSFNGAINPTLIQ